MAVLSNADRASLWAEIMQAWSNERTPCGVNKPDLRAAVDAIDDWVNTNAAVFNLAIPQPARGALTARQKAQLLTLVVRRRFEVS